MLAHSKSLHGFFSSPSHQTYWKYAFFKAEKIKEKKQNTKKRVTIVVLKKSKWTQRTKKRSFNVEECTFYVQKSKRKISRQNMVSFTDGKTTTTWHLFFRLSSSTNLINNKTTNMYMKGSTCAIYYNKMYSIDQSYMYACVCVLYNVHVHVCIVYVLCTSIVNMKWSNG